MYWWNTETNETTNYGATSPVNNGDTSPVNNRDKKSSNSRDNSPGKSIIDLIETAENEWANEDYDSPPKVDTTRHTPFVLHKIPIPPKKSQEIMSPKKKMMNFAPAVNIVLSEREGTDGHFIEDFDDHYDDDVHSYDSMASADY
jgi:hypothetical protein